MEKFCSKFLYFNIEEKNEKIKLACECLEGDKLKLARYMPALCEVHDIEQLFVAESIVQKLKTVGAFLVVAVPLIISIIQLIMGLRKPL